MGPGESALFYLLSGPDQLKFILETLIVDNTIIPTVGVPVGPGEGVESLLQAVVDAGTKLRSLQEHCVFFLRGQCSSLSHCHFTIISHVTSLYPPWLTTRECFCSFPSMYGLSALGL